MKHIPFALKEKVVRVFVAAIESELASRRADVSCSKLLDIVIELDVDIYDALDVAFVVEHIENSVLILMINKANRLNFASPIVLLIQAFCGYINSCGNHPKDDKGDDRDYCNVDFGS